jgi:hypothetical protein
VRQLSNHAAFKFTSDGAVDDARVDLLDLLVAKAKLGQLAGDAEWVRTATELDPLVLHEDIGVLEHFVNNLLALLRLEVQSHPAELALPLARKSIQLTSACCGWPA